MEESSKGAVAAIVLAAGQAARLGGNKLLLPLGGKPVLHWVLDALLGARLAQVIVVLGHESGRIRQGCERFGSSVTFIENPSYAEGRATSVQAGLDFLGSTVPAVLVTPGDVPFVSEQLLTQLIDRFSSTGRITYPMVHGRKGHPVIFPASSFPLLRGLSGDETLHDYFRQHPEITAALSWHDEGCVLDIDTENDMMRAASYCADNFPELPQR